MVTANRTMNRFFGVVGSGQAYLNILYLLAAFPLGIFYFIFLVTGLSASLPLFIVWIGIPLLLFVAGGWWLMAVFERQMAIHWLKEEITPMSNPVEEDADMWTRLKDYLTNPVTWKSLAYLFVKFPLGILSFVVVITALALTLSFLTLPFTFQFLESFNVGIRFGPGVPVWRIGSLNDALIGSLIGLLLWPISLHAINGMTWVHAKFAKIMLGQSVASASFEVVPQEEEIEAEPEEDEQK